MAVSVIQQVTIVGTGLMGGSLGLALRRHGFAGRIVGCDQPQVLEQARARGAIHEGFPDPRRATEGSQVVVLAMPVGHIIDFLERYGPVLPPETLLTDVGSTKGEILARARSVFGEQAPQRFLAGHPMAGKERSGIEHADAGLFQGAVWLVVPQPGQTFEQGLAAGYLKLVEAIGSRVLPVPLEQHDRLCAWISHLPQMMATALAATLLEELGDDPDLLSIGGRALREFTRIAASPYSMWRDIAMTNTENIARAMLRMEQRLAHLRENLRTRELGEEFAAGNRWWQATVAARSAEGKPKATG